jgi:hypothetical protein
MNAVARDIGQLALADQVEPPRIVDHSFYHVVDEPVVGQLGSAVQERVRPRGLQVEVDEKHAVTGRGQVAGQHERRRRAAHSSLEPIQRDPPTGAIRGWPVGRPYPFRPDHVPLQHRQLSSRRGPILPDYQVPGGEHRLLVEHLVASQHRCSGSEGASSLGQPLREPFPAPVADLADH